MLRGAQRVPGTANDPESLPSVSRVQREGNGTEKKVRQILRVFDYKEN
jgi:hypothetical protein